MIGCIVIGFEQHVNDYTNRIESLNYFRIDSKVLIPADESAILIPDLSKFSAVFFVSSFPEIVNFLVAAIKFKSNVFCVDQFRLTVDQLEELHSYHLESQNLFFIDIPELHHPLVKDFVLTKGSHLMFRYSKSLSSKRQIHKVLITALSFLTLLSPMQAKKLDVSTIETTVKGHPTIKIKLKMYDSSIAYIFIAFEKQEEHQIVLESKEGNFIFNFTENYLENVHGTRFESPICNLEQQHSNSIEAFALAINLNTKPIFSLFYYVLTVRLLRRMENLL